MPVKMLKIKSGEILKEKPFTHPDHTFSDLVCVHAILERVCLALEHTHMFPPEKMGLRLTHTEPDGRQHKLVLTQPRRLAKAVPLWVVGFFGQRQPGADISPLSAVNEKLIGEFPQNPDLLSYSSVELAGGDYGNVVLFGGEGAKDSWNNSRRHAEAVRDLAPGYYASIRLYNGLLPSGIMTPKGIRLHRVKYYEYSPEGLWKAVREFE